MSVEATPGATPEPTPTPATGNNPQPAVNSADEPGATPEPISANLNATELRVQLERAEARKAELNQENSARRRENTTLKNELAAAQAELVKWREVGESPDKARESLTAGKAAIETAAKLSREKVVNEAAALRGYKTDVLEDLMESKAFNVEVRDIKDKDGKDAKAPFALFKEGEKDVEKPLEDFVNEKLASYVVALKAEQKQTDGTPWFKQVHGDQKPQFNEEAARKEQAPLYNSF